MKRGNVRLIDSSSFSCAFEGKFRTALFDDTLFEYLLASFRDGGQYKLDNLDVRILGIALQYGQFSTLCVCINLSLVQRTFVKGLSTQNYLYGSGMPLSIHIMPYEMRHLRYWRLQ